MRFRKRKRKPEPEPLPVRPRPTIFELLDGVACATDPLPEEVYKTQIRFFSECPSCQHPLAVHTFTQPCPLCVWELRWGGMALNHLHCCGGDA